MSNDTKAQLVPLFRCSLPLTQLKQKAELQDDSKEEGETIYLADEESLVVGLGRNHSSQGTMITVRMLGVVHHEGDVMVRLPSLPATQSVSSSQAMQPPQTVPSSQAIQPSPPMQSHSVP